MIRVECTVPSACVRYAFDLLHGDRDDLRRSLSSAAPCCGSTRRRCEPALIYIEHMEGDEGEAMFRQACRLGLAHRLEASGEPLQVGPV